MLHAFTVGFKKAAMSCLLLSRFVRFTLFCTVASLKVPAITVYDVATMVLGKELFPQLKITDLNSSITVIMSSPEELLR